jgi:hypothetical protein
MVQKAVTHVQVPADKLVGDVDLFNHIAIDKQFFFYTYNQVYEHPPHAQGCLEKALARTFTIAFWAVCTRTCEPKVRDDHTNTGCGD